MIKKLFTFDRDIDSAFHFQGACVIYSSREEQHIGMNLIIGNNQKVMLNSNCVMRPVLREMKAQCE